MEDGMFWRSKRRTIQQKIALAMFFILVCSMTIQAQDTTTLSGTVTDPQGKVVPGATVTLINIATSVRRDARSGDNGAFSFNQVPPGNYNLRVEAKGFKTSVQENL